MLLEALCTRLIVVGVFEEGCVPGIMPLILIIPRSVMPYI